MERIRRSIRESFRRRPKERKHRTGSLVETLNVPQPGASGVSGTGSKVELWLPDEAAVKDGTCSFNVKYLGGTEVFESRGMQVCEDALKKLRAQRRHPVKAILYVSGDGLRVVDQENNRGLIVDQTIEKVSFCAPDRNHDKGFAYICRDGSSRRWMCHGFLATKESGERLSHAVGCAFAVCLEKKKKRDEEATLAAQAAADLLPPSGGDHASTSLGFTLKALPGGAPKYDHLSGGASESNRNDRFDRSNQTYNSFRRQLSLSERIQDPQTAILQELPAASQVASTLHITPMPRPAANPLLFERQGSLRAPSSSTSFRRQYSVHGYPTSQFKNRYGNEIARPNEPIFESDEDAVFSDKTGSFRDPGFPIKLHATAPNGFKDVDGTSYGTSANISKSRVLADEWLERTLKTSLSINSSLKNVETLPQSRSYSAIKLEGPPDQPPPPLPPLSVMNSSSRSNVFGKGWTGQNSLEDKPVIGNTQLPGVRNIYQSAPKTQTNAVGLTSGVDLFGQTIFNPLPTPDEASVKESHSNGSLNNYLDDKSGELDPFDVKWSELVVKSTSFCQQAPGKSTNPFSNELYAVKS